MLAPIFSIWFLIATLAYFAFDGVALGWTGAKLFLYELATSPMLFFEPIGKLIGELLIVGYMASTGHTMLDPRTHKFAMDMTYYLIPSLSTMAGVLCWMLG